MVRRVKRYFHDLKDWPRFRWKQERLAEQLAEVRHRQGRLIGRMEALGFQFRAEAVLQRPVSIQHLIGGPPSDLPSSNSSYRLCNFCIDLWLPRCYFSNKTASINMEFQFSQ